MDHIDLARGPELVLLAPATADLVGRVAGGLATDLLTTLLLAVPQDVPRLVAPAMNPFMWEHPAVRRNIAQLEADGWRVVEPAEGHMACGDQGRGRFPEPAVLVELVAELLGG